MAIWFSHPSLFVMAGVGVSLGLCCLSKKEWKEVRRLSIAYSFWALSFIICYFVSLRDLSQNKAQLAAWAKGDAYMPFPPLSLSSLIWFPNTFFKVFDYPVRLHLIGA